MKGNSKLRVENNSSPPKENNLFFKRKKKKGGKERSTKGTGTFKIKKKTKLETG
jgi:hypothetical protein